MSIDVREFDSLNESKYYTKLKIGLIRYDGEFKDITLNQKLTDQIPKLINVIEDIHITEQMRQAILHLYKTGWVHVYTVPLQQFIFLRRDMFYTYPDFYNIKIEANNLPMDIVTKVEHGTGLLQLIVPDTTSDLASGKVSRVLSRQLHHEIGHFIYDSVKNSYYVKNRLIIQFYRKLFFESSVFIGGDTDSNKDRWLFIITRFLSASRKLNAIEVESLSINQIRTFENRIKILFKSFDGFIGNSVDVDYIKFLESILRKVINIDEDAMNMVSESIRMIYKEMWMGSFIGARIDKRNKYYQELLYPNEVFARFLEGCGRNHSNKIYGVISSEAMLNYPDREKYLKSPESYNLEYIPNIRKD